MFHKKYNYNNFIYRVIGHKCIGIGDIFFLLTIYSTIKLANE